MKKYEKVMLCIAIIALVIDLLSFLIKQKKKTEKKSAPKRDKLSADLYSSTEEVANYLASSRSKLYDIFPAVNKVLL